MPNKLIYQEEKRLRLFDQYSVHQLNPWRKSKLDMEYFAEFLAPKRTTKFRQLWRAMMGGFPPSQTKRNTISLGLAIRVQRMD